MVGCLPPGTMASSSLMSEAPRSEYSRELTWPARFPEEQLRHLRPAGIRSDAEKNRIRGRHRTPPPARPYVGLLQENLMQHTSEWAWPESSVSGISSEELGAQWESWAQMTMQALDKGEPPPSPPRCALGPQDAPPEVLRVVEAATTAAAALTHRLGGSQPWPYEPQASCECLDAGSDWSSEANSRRTAVMARSASRGPRGTTSGYSHGAGMMRLEGRGRWRKGESTVAPKVLQRWRSAPRIVRMAGGDFHDLANPHDETDAEAFYNQDGWATAVSSNGWHVPCFQINHPRQQQYQQPPQQHHIDPPPRHELEEDPLLHVTNRLENEVRSLRQALIGNGADAGRTHREPGLLDFSNQSYLFADGYSKGLPGHGQGLRTEDGASGGKENLNISRMPRSPGVGSASIVGSDLHAVLDRLDVECARLADVLGVDTP